MSIIISKNISNGARSGQQRMLLGKISPAWAEQSCKERSERSSLCCNRWTPGAWHVVSIHTVTVGLEDSEAFVLPSSPCIQDCLSLIPGWYFSKCGVYCLCRIASYAKVLIKVANFLYPEECLNALSTFAVSLESWNVSGVKGSVGKSVHSQVYSGCWTQNMLQCRTRFCKLMSRSRKFVLHNFQVCLVKPPAASPGW
jgi:hypothetical protein